jgi:hypothetical protein
LLGGGAADAILIGRGSRSSQAVAVHDATVSPALLVPHRAGHGPARSRSRAAGSLNASGFASAGRSAGIGPLPPQQCLALLLLVLGPRRPAPRARG